MASRSTVIHVRVARIAPAAAGIKVFELVDVRDEPLPPFAPGAHIFVHLPGVGARQYSLCGPVADRSRYRIAVLRQERGRGGSKYMHDVLEAGDALEISPPANNFPLIESARHYVLIAGGIGITPMLPMVEELHTKRASFQLYYCARSPEQAAFRELLSSPALQGTVVFHFDGGDRARSLDVAALLTKPVPGSHLYCCGPDGLMEAVRQAAASWAANSVHFEHFQAPPAHSGAEQMGFEVLLAKSGRRVQVPPHKSIVRALREEGVAVETSCEAGVCGTCRTRYLGGEPIHTDLVLTQEEQQSFVMLCCSRASGILVLDL